MMSRTNSRHGTASPPTRRRHLPSPPRPMESPIDDGGNSEADEEDRRGMEEDLIRTLGHDPAALRMALLMLSGGRRSELSDEAGVEPPRRVMSQCRESGDGVFLQHRHHDPSAVILSPPGNGQHNTTSMVTHSVTVAESNRRSDGSAHGLSIGSFAGFDHRCYRDDPTAAASWPAPPPPLMISPARRVSPTLRPSSQKDSSLRPEVITLSPFVEKGGVEGNGRRRSPPRRLNPCDHHVGATNPPIVGQSTISGGESRSLTAGEFAAAVRRATASPSIVCTSQVTTPPPHHPWTDRRRRNEDDGEVVVLHKRRVPNRLQRLLLPEIKSGRSFAAICGSSSGRKTLAAWAACELLSPIAEYVQAFVLCSTTHYDALEPAIAHLLSRSTVVLRSDVDLMKEALPPRCIFQRAKLLLVIANSRSFNPYAMQLALARFDEAPQVVLLLDALPRWCVPVLPLEPRSGEVGQNGLPSLLQLSFLEETRRDVGLLPPVQAAVSTISFTLRPLRVVPLTPPLLLRPLTENLESPLHQTPLLPSFSFCVRLRSTTTVNGGGASSSLLLASRGGQPMLSKHKGRLATSRPNSSTPPRLVCVDDGGLAQKVSACRDIIAEEFFDINLWLCLCSTRQRAIKLTSSLQTCLGADAVSCAVNGAGLSLAQTNERLTAAVMERGAEAEDGSDDVHIRRRQRGGIDADDATADSEAVDAAFQRHSRFLRDFLGRRSATGTAAGSTPGSRLVVVTDYTTLPRLRHLHAMEGVLYVDVPLIESIPASISSESVVNVARNRHFGGPHPASATPWIQIAFTVSVKERDAIMASSTSRSGGLSWIPCSM